MKVIIVALAFVALAAAASLPEEIPIVRSVFTQEPAGGYNFDFETGNGIIRSETGELKTAVDEENKSHDVVVVRGSYTYTNDEGKVETVNYFADETGYHAQGDSIPTLPARR